MTRRSQATDAGHVPDASTWEQEMERWMAPFLEGLGHKGRRRWAPLYMEGLLGPGDRKSVQPMAARIAPADHEQLHHFIATSAWDPAPLEAALAHEAERLVGGREAVLIVDDTSLLKQGRHSVGVARQYSGQAGKTTNCQCLVSLTLARGEVPVPIALRLFLPTEWTDTPARLRRAGVPSAARTARTKGEIALAELDRVRAAGVTAGTVLADAGYGASAPFRHALTARKFLWAVGIQSTQKVFPVAVRVPTPRARAPRGRPRVHGVPSHVSRSAARMLDGARWRSVTWRRGTRGPLHAEFAAVRVRVADGARASYGRHQPGEIAWLVGEQRAHGVRKYYLTNHPAGTPLRTLAAVIKARWSCEQAHQQMKEELGLDHFEGRGWLGLHHHALFSMLAFAFLQHLRLGTPRRKKNAARPATRTLAPRRAARAPRTRLAGPTPLPRLSRPRAISSTTVTKVAK
jgi:SRSO17 transposase